MTKPDWQRIADRVEAVLTEHYGLPPARASISFLGVEPIEILRFQQPDGWAYCSLGMARHPMTTAQASVVDIAGPRAELLLEVRADPDAEARRIGAGEVWKALAVFAAAPTVESFVYGPGMTVDSGRPVASTSRCTGALVVESGLADIVTDAGLVSVLQLLPATASELAWARMHSVRELQQRYTEHRVDLRDLGRPAMSLS